MKRVRITIDLREADLPPTFERWTWNAEEPRRLEIVNWNVSNPPAGFLVRFRGDRERFERIVEADPHVLDLELLPVDDREAYCFLESEGTETARALFENFTRGA